MSWPTFMMSSSRSFNERSERTDEDLKSGLQATHDQAGPRYHDPSAISRHFFPYLHPVGFDDGSWIPDSSRSQPKVRQVDRSAFVEVARLAGELLDSTTEQSVDLTLTGKILRQAVVFLLQCSHFAVP
jgi:hypothetical protein